METFKEQSRIAIWGTVGSGKTMLINAFAKEINWYNENDPEFSYSLRDSDGRYLYHYLDELFTQPTSLAEDHLWIFERRGKISNSRSHQISSWSHQIIVHDNPGSNLINALVDPRGEELTLETLINSDSIIILLDPTNIKHSPVSSEFDVRLSKFDYSRLLESLVNTVLDANQRKLNIALCISKSDLLKIERPAEELIKVIFGDDILRAFQHPQINIKCFRVSSVGRVRVLGGKVVPNISEDAGHIREPNAWNPVNVVSPFFWLFEAIERKKISSSSKFSPFGDRLNYYLPYPPPR